MKLTSTLNTFLVAALIVSDGEEDRRMTVKALTDRVDFGQQQSGWAIDATRELGSLGYLVPYSREGGDEDQFVQITSSGKRKAMRLIGEGLKLRWLSTWDNGATFSDGSKWVTEAPASDFLQTMEIAPDGRSMDEMIHLDHSAQGYAEVAEGIEEAIQRVSGDNEIEDREGVLAGLRYAQTLWARTSMKRVELTAGVLLTIDYACEKARQGYSAVFLTSLAALVRKFAKDKLHLDVDNLFG